MTARAALRDVLDRLPAARVACTGDVMLDHYVSGRAERISPEAPVPVLRVEQHATMPGGMGNVVRNLRALGADVRFASVTGDDAAGRELAAALGEDDDDSRRLLVEPGRTTTVKTRFIAGGQQLLRADEETVAMVSAAIQADLLDWLDRCCDCRSLILSDYGKGVLLADRAAGLIARARGHGLRVVVDPKGADYHRYHGAHIVTPNRRELAQATGATVVAGEEADAARALMARHGFEAVVVTVGAQGMLVIEADGRARELPAEAREVFDVSGAGDTVVATLAAALAVDAPLEDAAALANVAAGIVVGKVGTAVAASNEIAAELSRKDVLVLQQKLLTVEEAAAQREAWRRRGLRVGFTNGCFDLIHPGHVSLLQQARAACDRLIVGLNSDASVTRLKGPGRPVQAQDARAVVLTSFAMVDAVVIFADDTPLALIEALRPDVLVKGADYRLDQVVGADLVTGYGGRVLLASLLSGHSTSATIRDMNRTAES